MKRINTASTQVISGSEFRTATIYWHGTFVGFAKIEARGVRIRIERYAQFKKAVIIEHLERGKRKWRFHRETSRPSTIILEGWGHPDLPPAFDSTGRSRHYSFDDAWNRDFDSFLQTYLATSGAKVLLDLRGHNSEEETFSHEVGLNIPPIVNEPETFREGQAKEIERTIFERDSAARAKCIQRFGCQCDVCGFDFSKTYGDIGNGYIHVHHLKPLSEIRADYIVNPIDDLRPVCPNCHAMLHRTTPPLTIEQLKAVVQYAKRSG